MKKKYAKICFFISILLLLNSQIISSTSNLTNSNQRTSFTSSETIPLNNNFNSKIEAAIQMVNESMLREFLTVLSVDIGIRFTQTDGSKKAAKYIFEQFSSMRLETRYNYWADFNNGLPLKFYKDKNVEATLNGTDNSNKETLIINAHYDSGIVSPGAIDDGSGVAAVLAAAYVLSQFEFNRTIKFVAFSGEEVGLIGSRNYVRELYKNNEDVLVEFNADMVGCANTSEEGRTVYISKTQDAQWVIDEIKKVNQDYGLNFNINNAWNLTAEGTRHGSDFFDFVLHGYEAIAFWESGNYGHAHTSNDTIDKVNFSYLTNMTKLIVASLAHLADIETYYPDVKIEAPKRGQLYFKDNTIRNFKHEYTLVIDQLLVCAKVKPGDSSIEKVEFYYDSYLVFTDIETPYQWVLNKLSINKHTIQVIAYDEKGRSASDKINFYFINLNSN
jgi:hypothetical protein